MALPTHKSTGGAVLGEALWTDPKGFPPNSRGLPTLSPCPAGLPDTYIQLGDWGQWITQPGAIFFEIEYLLVSQHFNTYICENNDIN
jgi:hypothetical protein